MSITRVPPAPARRPSGTERRWAAARDEYLAGSAAEAVCRRHDIRLATFRRRALEEGWRRLDQPDPEPAPQRQDAPPVIPEALLETASPADLTAARMMDKAWSHLQAAIVADLGNEHHGVEQIA